MDTSAAVAAAAVIADFRTRGEDLLCLVHDELAFQRTFPSRTTAAKGGGGEGPPPRKLYAVYVGKVSALTVEPHLAKIRDYVAQTPKSAKLTKKAIALLDGALLMHPVEVGDFVARARAGTSPRNCEVLIGDSYRYPDAAATTAAAAAGANEVLYESDAWRELRAALVGPRGQRLRTLNFALACTGQAYGLASRMENLTKATAPADAAAVPGIPEGWGHAVELLRRANLVGRWGGDNDGGGDGSGAVATLVRFDLAALKMVADAQHKQIKAVCKRASKQQKKAKQPPDGGPTPYHDLDQDIEAQLDGWLAHLRDDGCAAWASSPADEAEGAAVPARPDDQGSARLKELLEMLGSKVPAEGVDLLIRSGSSMYNLATGASDVDYFVVFTSATRQLLDRVPPQSRFEAHVAAPIGANKAGEIECTGCELGSYLVDLAKGSPTVVELLFSPAGQAIHTSLGWNDVVQHRMGFVTQRCVGQYVGFIDNRLHMVRRLMEQHPGEQLPADQEPAAAKLLYHAFHKLFDLRRIVAYQAPQVFLEDGSEERDFIMAVRTTRPLVKVRDRDFSPAGLLDQAVRLRDEVLAARLANDKQRREDADPERPVRPDEVDIAVVARLLERIRRRQLPAPGDGHRARRRQR